MVLRKSPPRSKPLRLNGLKAYHYDIENYPDPVDKDYPFDGVYRRTTPGNGPFYLSEFAKSDGTTLEEYIKSLGGKYNKLLRHRYESPETFLDAARHIPGGVNPFDLADSPDINVITVSHSMSMITNSVQASRNPGKGYGIAVYYDPQVEGIKGIKGVGAKYKTKSLPPNPIWNREYNGEYDMHSFLVSEYFAPTKDTYYHVIFQPNCAPTDLGVCSEKELIHRGILPDSFELLKIRKMREIKTAGGKYELNRVHLPKIKGKAPPRELSWDQYLTYMRESGVPLDDSGHIDYSVWRKDPIYDLTTLGSEKPQRTRKVKKG